MGAQCFEMLVTFLVIDISIVRLKNTTNMHAHAYIYINAGIFLALRLYLK